MESRVEELEMRLTFQEDHLQHLTDSVAQQRKDIEELRIQVKYLADRLQSLSAGGVSHGDEPPPPHY